MPQTAISLYSRILFIEEYNNGSHTDWQEYARVGSFESHPVVAIIRINLQGELSSSIHGRLNLDENAFIRLEVSDHNYQGTFKFCALDIENNTITEIDDLAVINGFINLPINAMHENDAIFTCALYPNVINYHEFFHIDYNHAELIVNETIDNISHYPISILGDNGNNIVNQYVGDYLFTYIEIEIMQNKTVEALLKSNSIVSSNIGQQSVNISGYIIYGGVSYFGEDGALISKTIASFNAIMPTLTRYDNTSNFNVLNIYYPHDVLHNFNNPNYKAPAILYIHGGEWCSLIDSSAQTGDTLAIDPRFEEGDYMTELLSRGFIVISMEYNGIIFDENQTNIGGNCSSMLIDIDNAISYLNSNANNLHIDNSKLCLWGYSAGGHLALMYAYTMNENGFIKLVVSEAGPTHFDSQNTDVFVEAMRGGATFDEVSPNNLYSSSNSVYTLLIYSQNDDTVSYYHGLSLQSTISNANLCKLITVYCDHSGYNYSDDNSTSELSIILDWYKLL